MGRPVGRSGGRAGGVCVGRLVDSFVGWYSRMSMADAPEEIDV